MKFLYRSLLLVMLIIVYPTNWTKLIQHSFTKRQRCLFSDGRRLTLCKMSLYLKVINVSHCWVKINNFRDSRLHHHGQYSISPYVIILFAIEAPNLKVVGWVKQICRQFSLRCVLPRVLLVMRQKSDTPNYITAS